MENQRNTNTQKYNNNNNTLILNKLPKSNQIKYSFANFYCKKIEYTHIETLKILQMYVFLQYLAWNQVYNKKIL